MGIMANIVCKTVGIAGMSAVLYDGYSLAKENSKRVAANDEADRFIKIHADTRTLTTESPINSAMQKKLADMRMNTPFFSAISSVKGFVGGFLNSLADNIVPVSCASIALAAKGLTAKIGAWGLAAYGLYVVAKEGFGFTKKSPMD